MRRLLVLALTAGSFCGVGYALTPAQASPICVGVTATIEGRTTSVGPTCPIPTPLATICNTIPAGVVGQAALTIYTCVPRVVAAGNLSS